MNVKDLLESLSKMPKESPVDYVWDGEARSVVRHVWLSKKGRVILSDQDEVVYTSSTRPVDAPGDECSYWKTEIVEDENDDPE